MQLKTSDRILLIGDTHLSPVKFNDEIESLTCFLNEKIDYNYLFLLGDIFDYFYEFKYYIPKNYFYLYNTLYNLSKRMQIHYWLGNHDFWHIDFLKKIGIKIHFKPELINIGDKKYFIAHGDNLKNEDIFNSFIKNEITQWFYKKIHPDISYEIGKFISKLSSNSSRNKNIRMDKYIEFAEKKFKEGVDVVLIAHIHNQFLYKKGNKIFVVIGDWKYRKNYCEIIDGKIFLKCDTQSPR